MLAQTDRDERLNWSIKENCSIFGKPFVTSKILMACSNAFWYTIKSLKLPAIAYPFCALVLPPAACCLLLTASCSLFPAPIFIC